MVEFAGAKIRFFNVLTEPRILLYLKYIYYFCGCNFE